MSQEFLDKVRYLCREIAKVEWSGALFYTLEGSIKKPEKMKVILKDILPLDKGTSAYTSYELDNRFIDYMSADEERLDWRLGHIHSHNTMGVFFSGTDTAELNDNCQAHNFYLSLIVNNFMDFVARIAIAADFETNITKKFTALDENGENYVIGQEKVNYKQTKMYWYDCEVISPKEQVVVGEEFSANVNEILKEKPVVKSVHTTVPAVKAANTPMGQNNIPAASVIANRKANPDWKSYLNEAKDRIDLDDPETSLIDDKIMDFTIELFKLSSENDKGDDLITTLGFLDDFGMTDFEISSSILDVYAALYEKHFPDADDKSFISDTWEVIDLLSEYAADYDFVPVVTEALAAIVNKYQKILDRC